MTGKERVYAVLNKQPADKIPIFPKLAFTTAKFSGHTVSEYMQDPVVLAECAVAAADRFGWDAVPLHTDISLDGMALGSEYTLGEDSPYVLKKYLMDSIEDIDRVKVRNPWDCPGYSTLLKATEHAVKIAGDRLFIQSWCNGPMNVASQLYNLQDLLVDTICEPEAVHELLELCTQAAAWHARELIKAGADAVAFGHATVSSNVVSRQTYIEFGLPYEKRIVDAIHEEGGIAITHICGRIEPIVDKIYENGSDIIDFDSTNDIRVLIEKTNGERVFRGNISPALFSNGRPEEVEQAVRDLLERDAGSGRLLVGSGCEINQNVTAENLAAFVRGART